MNPGYILAAPAFPFLARLFYIALLKMYFMATFPRSVLFNKITTDMLKSVIVSKPNYLVIAFCAFMPVH